MVQSRAKGNRAELEIAKLCETWWRRLEPGCIFARTPLSGGWGSPQQRAGFKASGDLMTTAVSFPFVVEIKRREGWAVSTFFAGKASPVFGWWAQARKAAIEQGGEPLLFFRKNREPWRFLLPSRMTDLIDGEEVVAERLPEASIPIFGTDENLVGWCGLASDLFAFDPARLAV